MLVVLAASCIIGVLLRAAGVSDQVEITVQNIAGAKTIEAAPQ